MNGAITTRDLFCNGWLIVRLFGVRKYAKCFYVVIVLHRSTTFLEQVW